VAEARVAVPPAPRIWLLVIFFVVPDAAMVVSLNVDNGQHMHRGIDGRGRRACCDLGIWHNLLVGLNDEFSTVLLQQERRVLQQDGIKSPKRDDDLARAILQQDEEVVLLKQIPAQDRQIARGNTTPAVRYQSCAESECHELITPLKAIT